jgi:CHAD domain-containing protein
MNDGGAQTAVRGRIAEQLETIVMCEAGARLESGAARRAHRAARAVANDPDDQALHTLRIHAKRVHYAAELVVGRRAARVVEQARRVQDALGSASSRASVRISRPARRRSSASSLRAR